MLRQLKTGRRLATAFVLMSLAFIVAVQMVRGGHLAQAAPAALAAALPRPPAEPWKRELHWSRIRPDGSSYVQVLRDGGHVELTLDPQLQRRAEALLAQYPTPYASVVAVSVED